MAKKSLELACKAAPRCDAVSVFGAAGARNVSLEIRADLREWGVAVVFHLFDGVEVECAMNVVIALLLTIILYVVMHTL